MSLSLFLCFEFLSLSFKFEFDFEFNNKVNHQSSSSSIKHHLPSSPINRKISWNFIYIGLSSCSHHQSTVIINHESLSIININQQSSSIMNNHHQSIINYYQSTIINHHSASTISIDHKKIDTISRQNRAHQTSLAWHAFLNWSLLWAVDGPLSLTLLSTLALRKRPTWDT